MNPTFHLGERLGPLEKPPVTKLQLVKYAGASGDFNPIHVDDAFASSLGLGGVIAHGMLTMGFLGQLLTDTVGTEGRLKEFGVRFLDMVRPGDVIVCEGAVQECKAVEGMQEVRCEVWATVKASDRKVLAGTAVFQIPERTEGNKP